MKSLLLAITLFYSFSIFGQNTVQITYECNVEADWEGFENLLDSVFILMTDMSEEAESDTLTEGDKQRIQEMKEYSLNSRREMIESLENWKISIYYHAQQRKAKVIETREKYYAQESFELVDFESMKKYTYYTSKDGKLKYAIDSIRDKKGSPTFDYRVEYDYNDTTNILGYTCHKVNVHCTKIFENGERLDWEQYEIYVTDELDIPFYIPNFTVFSRQLQLIKGSILFMRGFDYKDPNFHFIFKASELNVHASDESLELPEKYQEAKQVKYPGATLDRN